MEILAHWFDTHELRTLELAEITGGLSGARLWRVTIADISYILRSWPRGKFAGSDLPQIHGLMEHAWNAGFREIPVPRRTLNQQTLVSDDGQLWDLARWLAGEVVSTPDLLQANAAMTALAKFHLAVATFQEQRYGIAPGLLQRVCILDDLRAGALTQLTRAVHLSARSELRDIAKLLVSQIEVLLPIAIELVYKSAEKPFPLQWCLGDIHVGNVLFVGGQVTGLIDFGAACEDSVARDVARLGSSAAGSSVVRWHGALDAYQRYRPLSADELQAVRAYDLGGSIGTAANWLRWLFIENRTFTDAVTTQARLVKLAQRLDSLLNK